MLPNVVVVVDVAQGLIQQVLLAANGEGSGDVELLIIGAVGAFDMGVFLEMALVVLDQATAEAVKEPSELLDLHPRPPSELLPVVYGEDDLRGHPMGAKPGSHPQIPTETIGPASLPGIADEFES